MAENLARQRVLKFLEAFYGGDTEAALKCCADNVLMMIYLPVELFPHLGPRRGNAVVAELMGVHDARCSQRRCDVKFMLADRQSAAAIVDVAFTKRTDGRVVQLTCGNFFVMRHGLLTEIRSFFDTVDMISQMTGRDMVGPLLREAGSELRPPNVTPPPLKRAQ